MGKQYAGTRRAPGYRVERDARGRFTDIKSIHRSIKRDAATKAKKKKKVTRSKEEVESGAKTK